jgi:hypothetical protein
MAASGPLLPFVRYPLKVCFEPKSTDAARLTNVRFTQICEVPLLQEQREKVEHLIDPEPMGKAP